MGIPCPGDPVISGIRDVRASFRGRWILGHPHSRVTTPYEREENGMAKGYWIGRVDVTNPDGYKAYVAANAEPFRKYGARFLVRAGKSETMEGASRSRNVVIEFKDYTTALACYRSPEYQRAMALRKGHADADINRGLRRPAAGGFLIGRPRAFAAELAARYTGTTLGEPECRRCG